MEKSIARQLACAGFAALLCLAPGLWRTASADDDNRRRSSTLSIEKVLVTFEDPANDLKDTIRITVAGVDLDRARQLAVMFGDQGTLDVVSASGSEIVALCPAPDFICDAGDLRLRVLVQTKWRRGDDDDDDDDRWRWRGRVQSASYDLTIGAVGPVGPRGEIGPQGLRGPQGAQGEEGPPGPLKTLRFSPRPLTGFLNSFDRVLNARCDTLFGPGHVLIGLYSEHSNFTEDRKWRFYCTRITLE